jgi:hypothetical protein
MKKKVLFTLLLMLALAAFAGVKESKVIEVNIPKFGVYHSETMEMYQSVNKYQESQSKMDGKGFWGSLVAKFFPTGKQGSILNLDEKMTYSINFDKKTFQKNPIEKFFDDEEEDDEYTEAEESDDETESRYRIIRQELTVKEGKKKTKINQFEAREYNILYLLEKEEIATKKRLTDSLFVTVFTSEDEKMFTKANDIKSEHNKAIMEAIGLPMEEEEYNQMLGMNWISMLSAMDTDTETAEMEIDYAKLKKIKGSPVLVEGNFYQKEFDPSLRPQAQKPKEKKKFGGFGLSNIVDKIAEDVQESAENKEAASNNQYKMLLSYRTETKEITFETFSENTFLTPDGFKEVK